MTQKKKLKSLIGFHSANKMDNYNRGGEKKGAKKEKPKRIYRTCQNIRIINVFLVLLSFPESHSPPYLTRMPSSTMFISGPDLGATQIVV